MRLIATLVFCVTILTVTAYTARADDGFTPIFNGTSLDGWAAPDMGFWSVVDGAITGQSTAEKPCTANQFLVWQLGEVDDFELSFQFRIEGQPEANSGVQFRSHIAADGHAVGYQADIDRGMKWLGCLYDEHTDRKMLGAHAQQVTIDPDGKKNVVQLQTLVSVLRGVDPTQWTRYRIVARGPLIQIFVNDQMTTQVIDRSTRDADAIGKLALQLHAGPAMRIQYKDIALKRLPLEEGRKKIVFVAGRASHGYGAHEHKAGCMLLARLLNECGPKTLATVYTDGYPKDPTAFDNADAVVFFADGGGGHPAIDHLDAVNALVKRGVGIDCIHYGVEITKGQPGDAMLDWTGGYFETEWSVNPHWAIKDPILAKGHPITRGVGPITVNDEWYYHMRFRPNMRGVTPILSAVPPDTTVTSRWKPGQPAKAHEGNADVYKAVVENHEPQHLAWAFERPAEMGGGRGFGFTGAHVHWNWANDGFRTLVLNAIAWSAGAEVPEAGITTDSPTLEELEANQDFERPNGLKREKIAEMVEQIKAAK